MAKARTVDAKLARLRLLRTEPITPVLVAELQVLIADKSNLVVAEAAEVVGERSLRDLALTWCPRFKSFS